METKDELEQVVLLDAEYKLLSRMKRKQLHLNEKTDGMHALFAWGFVAPDPDESDTLNRPRYKETCHITERGERYLAYRKMQLRESAMKRLLDFALGFASGILIKEVPALLERFLQ